MLNIVTNCGDSLVVLASCTANLQHSRDVCMATDSVEVICKSLLSLLTN